VMGAGGVVVPPATYWDKIQAVLKKYDILLIADEVICGFGRTGKMFGFQHADIQPDLVTVARRDGGHPNQPTFDMKRGGRPTSARCGAGAGSAGSCRKTGS